MKQHEKKVETVDEETRLKREYELLLDSISKKRKLVEELQHKIHAVRIQNKETSGKLKSMQYQLADSFLSLPEGVQEVQSPEDTPLQTLMARVDDQQLSRLVEEERIRMQLEISRERMKYLEDQLQNVKEKGSAMTLSVTLKGQLERIRERQAKLDRRSDLLKARVQEESHCEADYNRMFN